MRKGLSPIELLVIIMVVGAIVLGAIYWYFQGNPPPAVPTDATPTAMHCGGFIKNAPTCPMGYHCVLNKIADTGGVCTPDSSTTSEQSSPQPVPY